MNTGLTLRTAHISGRGGHGPGRRDAAVRLRPGGRGAGDRAQGARPARSAGRGPTPRPPRAAAAAARRRPRGRATACGCCWSTTRTRSCTRWPTTSASRAPRWSPCGPASPPTLLDEFAPGPGGAVARAGPAGRLRPARRCWTSSTRAGCRCSASAWACRRMVEHAGGDAGAAAPTPCTASPARCGGSARRAAGRPPRRVHRGPLPLAARQASRGRGGFTVTAVTPDGW